jgi:hypothetical protein
VSEAGSRVRLNGWRPIRRGETFSGRLGDAGGVAGQGDVVGRSGLGGGEVENSVVPSAAHRRMAARGAQIHLLRILYMCGRLRGPFVYRTAARSRTVQPSSEDI